MTRCAHIHVFFIKVFKINNLSWIEQIMPQKPERASILNFLNLRATEIVPSQWGAVQAPSKSNTDLTTPNTVFSHQVSYLLIHIISEKRCSGQLSTFLSLSVIYPRRLFPRIFCGYLRFHQIIWNNVNTCPNRQSLRSVTSLRSSQSKIAKQKDLLMATVMHPQCQEIS